MHAKHFGICPIIAILMLFSLCSTLFKAIVARTIIGITPIFGFLCCCFFCFVFAFPVTVEEQIESLVVVVIHLIFFKPVHVHSKSAILLKSRITHQENYPFNIISKLNHFNRRYQVQVNIIGKTNKLLSTKLSSYSSTVWEGKTKQKTATYKTKNWCDTNNSSSHSCLK